MEETEKSCGKESDDVICRRQEYKADTVFFNFTGYGKLGVTGRGGVPTPVEITP